MTKVVLPAIRKDGGYIHGEEHVVTGEITSDEFIARALVMAERDAAVAEVRKTGIRLAGVEGKLIEVQPQIELASYAPNDAAKTYCPSLSHLKISIDVLVSRSARATPTKITAMTSHSPRAFGVLEIARRTTLSEPMLR